MTATTAAPAPGSPAWARLITASKVAAILGVSPYESPRSLWLKMRGDIPWDDGRNADAKSRGHYLENGVLDWWVDQHPEYAHVKRQHYTEFGTWAAATPDAAAWLTRPARSNAVHVRPAAVVDAKTSRDDAEWGTPGTDEVPVRYAAQLMWAMHVTGARVGYIALLTTFLDLREYRLDYDPDVAADVEGRCAAFLASLDDPDAIPPLDGSPATWRAEKRRHPDIDRDRTVELDRDLAARFLALKAREAEDRLTESEVRAAMGDARLAMVGDVVVARRQPNRSGVSLVTVARTLPEPTDRTAP